MQKASTSAGAKTAGNRKMQKSPNNGAAKAQKSAKTVDTVTDSELLYNPPAFLTAAEKERRKYLQARVRAEGESASTSSKSNATRPTDRKRHLQAEDPLPADANNNDTNKGGKVAQESASTQAAGTTKRKQPRSQGLEQTSPIMVNGEALACPLVRKSLPAAEAAKSCPLPSKKDSVTKSPMTVHEAPKVDSATSNSNEKQLATMPVDIHKTDSIEEGRRVLEWLINPVAVNQFFADFWENNACVVQRKNPNYYSKLMSFKMIDDILMRNRVEFGTNLDVTIYRNGKRETLNPEGRAFPSVVWDFYAEGCSIRILNPSTYLLGLRQVCSIMQEFFHCLVGANVYLTPPNSQGFAPHYDDIEAFVIQVEGRKRWRLYEPPEKADQLSRTSSGNYDQKQLGEPIIDEVLEAGDLLYFPRGTVHQAITEKGHFSLHITLSVYQQQAYANLLETLMPIVLKKAVKKSVALRRGLPLHTFHVLGEVQRTNRCESRDQLVENVQKLVSKYLMPSTQDIDEAVDQLAKKFQHEALPPIILPEEKVRTVFGSRSISDQEGNSVCDYEFDTDTSVRLLRANILRLVNEDDGSVKIYHHVNNALEYCKYEPNFLEILQEEAIAVEVLISAYPYYITVDQLPLKTVARKVEVATALWEHGLLMTEKPFK
ncbi:uncharacterized protein Dere_GG18702 [Drosophila erecta]|uniref:Bifunctional lysine-specific demethylase and histidyl-hydroxylase NO66 n=1 Tax=Drosophila erecta TaxID=7220 RepID=NO66_DROER|nr:RecName: Full=Bifunctional lysine-specific demethylase and histidyl-hydroxylase NO66; AltName: Full=Histone lysine demethylase NO66 [Drosophila erecta]EDV45796.1 uncharacterized protein Dere_GG18702 [Drosophila erecta]